MLMKKRLHQFANKVYETKNGLLFPGGLMVSKRKNILFVLESEAEGKRLHVASNIITNDGDLYYAQKVTGASPTDTFANLYLSTAAWNATHPKKASTAGDLASTAISGSSKAATGGYPKQNDTDTDNTGAGTTVVTWLFSYAKADFNATSIISGAIAASGVTFGSGSSHILTGFSLTSFDKSANDTLKVFVNHTMLGV